MATGPRRRRAPAALPDGEHPGRDLPLNVDRYAAASRATVRLWRSNGAVEVEVADDGRGGADPARGSGLRGLQDRLSAIDGTLDLDSAPGQGTRLRARVPLGA